MLTHNSAEVALIGRAFTSTRRLIRSAKQHITKITLLSAIARWAALITAGYTLGLVGRLAGIPAPHLVAGLVVGLGVAVSGLVTDRLPRSTYGWVQALVGVTMGSYMDLSALGSAAPAALPLTIVTAATVVISIWVAFRLSRKGRLDRPTATLSMVPGAASAMTVAADDLDVDIRVVGVSQYLRLGLVAIATPFVAAALATDSSSSAHHASMFAGLTHLVTGSNQVAGLLALVALAVLGTQVGRRLSLPAAAVLGPMLIAAVALSTGAAQGFAPDGILQDVVFTLVGLEVGLRFSRRSLAQLRGLLPRILVGSLLVILGCGVLSWTLAVLTNIPLTDAYLATTPGGIYLVIPVALALHANLALVSTVQSLRLFVVVLLAPPLVRWTLHTTKDRERPESSAVDESGRAVPADQSDLATAGHQAG